MRPLVTRVRAATYNVHGFRGTDGRCDADRISAVISELDADVVAIQEFTYPADVALETRTPIGLGSLASYECVLGPTRSSGVQSFGNLLLTRHPITALHRIDLSMSPYEERGALAATLDVEGLECHVLATHLGLRVSERRFQVRQILDYLDTVRPDRLIVLGDFNDWLPGGSVAHLLDRRLGKPARQLTFPVAWPVLPLDRIWVHPFESLTSVHVHRSPMARRASDHFPVVAEIEFPQAAQVFLADREGSQGREGSEDVA